MPAEEKPPIPSVWAHPKRRKREQPALSRDQIVAEALHLLDEEGVEALSMRRLGARLNAGATSFYSHVANKDELIELVVDEVYGEITIADPHDGTDPALGAGPHDAWRGPAMRCARSLRSAILRHPWMASVLGAVGVSYLGPNMMRLSEELLGIFRKAGFPADEADLAMTTLIAYVTGIAIGEAAWLTMVARTGETEEHWFERLLPTAEKAAESHPRLREKYAEQRDAHPGSVRDAKFEYGLQRVLDGLAARLSAPGSGA
ncbi:TetR/AcrR family transcriptional regulator [Streptomyces wuyuanensis]|uniref:TetR/AcrR family transcriptional regulator n=1 Tax=Streptomyces wuyuanensis TaxID=1196353 RepID=UPI0036C0561B